MEAEEAGAVGVAEDWEVLAVPAQPLMVVMLPANVRKCPVDYFQTIPVAANAPKWRHKLPAAPVLIAPIRETLGVLPIRPAMSTNWTVRACLPEYRAAVRNRYFVRSTIRQIYSLLQTDSRPAPAAGRYLHSTEIPG